MGFWGLELGFGVNGFGFRVQLVAKVENQVQHENVDGCILNLYRLKVCCLKAAPCFPPHHPLCPLRSIAMMGDECGPEFKWVAHRDYYVGGSLIEEDERGTDPHKLAEFIGTAKCRLRRGMPPKHSLSP